MPGANLALRRGRGLLHPAIGQSRLRFSGTKIPIPIFECLFESAHAHASRLSLTNTMSQPQSNSSAFSSSLGDSAQTDSPPLPDSFASPDPLPPSVELTLAAGFATCVIVVATGIVLRQTAVAYESELVIRLAGMVLFAPVTVLTLWLAWRTRITQGSLVWIAVTLAAMFAIWNSIMLQGLSIGSWNRAITLNLLHWILYVVVGAMVGRWVQWCTGIGIWSTRGQVEMPHDVEAAPARLTVGKLLAMTTLIAGILLLYRNWLVSSPSAPVVWYTWFPVEFKPWVSGGVGGMLLGVQALIVAIVLQAGSWRTAGLILWIAIAAAIRWGTNQLYWGGDSPRHLMPMPLQPEGELRFLNTTTPLWSAEGWVWLVEAGLQTGLLVAALVWLARYGYRVGWQRGVEWNATTAT